MNISILLPLFNGEKFLDECIKSIISQSYPHWKLYIGINGHGLNSELFKKISGKYNNNGKIIVKEYDIKSKPETLNLLKKEVKTDFVALIDVDDKWHKKKLEKQIPFLKKYDVVGTAGKYIGDNNIRIHIENGEISHEQIFFHNCFINSSIIMRTIDVDFDDVFLDDYNMWFKLIVKNRKFYNVNEVLTYHRIHKDSYFNHSNNDDVNKLKGKWLSLYGEKGVMMNRFGVSVIMPIFLTKYNDEDIKKSLDSVLNQVWKGYECLILINTDEMVTRIVNIINKNYNEEQKKRLSIKKLIPRRNNIHLKKQKMQNLKRKQYMNKCMKIGNYNLIAFIEPRDIWHPKKLFHQVFWIHKYDAICVGGEFYGRKNTGHLKNIMLPSNLPDNKKFYRSAVLIKRDKFKKYPQTYGGGRTFLFHRHMNLIKIWY